MLQTSALPLGYVAKSKWSGRRDSNSRPSPWQGDALPLSHSRKWCPEAESNHRHEDFQSSALPTELSGHINFFCIMIAHSLVLRTILRHCLKTTSLFLPLPYTDYRYLGIFNIVISLYYVNGRGRRNRTLISGFGDRHSTVELYPYNTNSF